MRQLCVIFCILLSNTVSAAYLHSVKPDKIMFGNNVAFGDAKQDAPSDTCNHWGRYWQFDATTDKGRNMMAALLAAKMADRSISIWYTPSPVAGTDHSNGCDGQPSSMAIIGAIGIE